MFNVTWMKTRLWGTLVGIWGVHSVGCVVLKMPWHNFFFSFVLMLTILNLSTFALVYRTVQPIKISLILLLPISKEQTQSTQQFPKNTGSLWTWKCYIMSYVHSLAKTGWCGVAYTGRFWLEPHKERAINRHYCVLVRHLTQGLSKGILPVII